MPTLNRLSRCANTDSNTDVPANPPDLLCVALRRYREAKGWSRSDLSGATVRLGFRGVPESTIEALEMKPGRVPEAEILELLAMALAINPNEFYEYPIAVARRAARVSSDAMTAADRAGREAAELLERHVDSPHEEPGRQNGVRKRRPGAGG